MYQNYGYFPPTPSTCAFSNLTPLFQHSFICDHPIFSYFSSLKAYLRSLTSNSKTNFHTVLYMHTYPWSFFLSVFLLYFLTLMNLFPCVPHPSCVLNYLFIFSYDLIPAHPPSYLLALSSSEIYCSLFSLKLCLTFRLSFFDLMFQSYISYGCLLLTAFQFTVDVTLHFQFSLISFSQLCRPFQYY